MSAVRLIIVSILVVLALGAPTARAALGASRSTSRPSQRSSFPTSSPSTRPARSQSYSERYSILEDRNIFLRDRSRRPGERDRSTTQPSKRPLEESLVLRGIVLEDEGYRAYVEDTSREETHRLAPGDSLAHGRVGAITIDAIAYDAGSAGSTGSPATTNASATSTQRTWVEVGYDLTGKPSLLLASSSAGSSAESLAAATQPVISPDVAKLNPNDPNLTLEQRMKLKRALELQKKQ